MGSTLTSASSLTSLQMLAPSLESKSCAVPAQRPVTCTWIPEVFTLTQPTTPDAGIRALMGKRPKNGRSRLTCRQENGARPQNQLRQMHPTIDPRSSGPQQNRNFFGPQKASFIILVRT